MSKFPTVQGSNLTITGARLSLDISIGGIAVGSIGGVVGDADSATFDVSRDMVLRYRKKTEGSRVRVGNSDMECRLRMDIRSIVASAACCESPSSDRLARNARPDLV